MDASKISVLANLLRKTGDAILHGDETLVLSDSLLQNINDSFTFLNDVAGDALFEVTHSNNSDLEIFHDIQFLHDFMQKILKLRITKDVYLNLRDPLSISKVRNLKVLELKQIPVNRINGIQSLRAQLMCVKCLGGIQQLKDLLVKCGADESSARVWEELIEVAFTHNGMDTVDCSLEYTPWLQKVDLSYNNFKSFSVTISLPNLKHLNLSFNILESIPILSREASNKLEVLILKNNYIKDLTGLSKFDNLLSLDMSCNSLHDHSRLAPLNQLASLQELNLIGNPLSFHKQHRINTVQQLHWNATRLKVVLDGKELSGKERSYVPNCRAPERPIAPRPIQGPFETTASDAVTSPQHNLVPKRLRHRKQVKEAVITEQTGNEEVDNSATEAASEAKEEEGQEARAMRLAEEARAQRMRMAWGVILPSSVSTATTAADSITSPTTTTSITSSTATATTQQQVSQQEDTSLSSPIISQPSLEGSTEDLSMTKEIIIEKETETETEVQAEDIDRAEVVLDLNALEEGQVFAATRISERGEKVDEKEVLLCVERDNDRRSLVERSATSGGVCKRWALPGAVLACELLLHAQQSSAERDASDNSERKLVRLTCDALRHGQQHDFLMDAPDALEFLRLVRDILESRSLAEMNQVEYWCMKCSSQFSREENILFSNRDVASATCPTCGSHIVCAVDTSDTTNISSNTNATTSATAVVDAVPAVVNSNPSIPSVASTASIASVPGGDSDVEVLSSPSHSRSRSRSNSQSSIEVLALSDSRGVREGKSKSIEPVSEVTKPTTLPPILTESSSSGSMTDSVCTTYEHAGTATVSDGPSLSSPLAPPLPMASNKVPGAGDGHHGEDGELEDALYGMEPVLSLQEMYEGLLESVERCLAPSAAPAKVPAPTSKVSGDDGGRGENERFTWEDPRCVDHRLQLFAAQELFETPTERLLLALRAEALRSSNATLFPALLLVSSLHIWLFQISGPERDWPGSWLTATGHWKVSALRWLEPLPRALGVALTISASGAIKSLPKGKGKDNSEETMLLVLQDPKQTDILLSHAEAALAGVLAIQQPPIDDLEQRVQSLSECCGLQTERGTQVAFLNVFSTFSSVVSGLESVSVSECDVSHGVVVIRERDIFVTEADLCWLLPGAPKKVEVQTLVLQEVCNLLEVEAWEREGLIVLHWEDESKWQVSFASRSIVAAFMTALRTPWEALFQVPLCIQRH